jgi:hypothetical protein
MLCLQASVVLADGTVAAAGSGGGIWGVQSTLVLAGSSLTDNTAVAGGGVYLSMCDAELNGSTLSDNRVSRVGHILFQLLKA